MLSSISHATQPQVAAPVAAQPAAAPKAAVQARPAAAPADTVQISAAAKLAQEAVETPAQTVKEAAGGDRQAQHLLAREAAQRTNG